MIAQGEVWWAELGEPVGSGPGYRRPVVIVQCDALNASRVGTVACVPLTSNLKWADAPGNLALTARATALDEQALTERVGKLARSQVEQILVGIDTLLGR